MNEFDTELMKQKAYRILKNLEKINEIFAENKAIKEEMLALLPEDGKAGFTTYKKYRHTGTCGCKYHPKGWLDTYIYPSYTFTDKIEKIKKHIDNNFKSLETCVKNYRQHFIAKTVKELIEDK